MYPQYLFGTHMKENKQFFIKQDNIHLYLLRMVFLACLLIGKFASADTHIVNSVPEYQTDLYNIQQLEKEIGKTLTELETFSVRSEEVGYLLDEHRNVTQLNLNGCQLSSIPKSLLMLKNLEVLGLKDNNLTELPDSFHTLQKLTVVTLENNQLRKLPISFDRLEKLTRLNLSGNNLNEFPSLLLKLRSLTGLGLGSNHLTELPASVSKLEKLNTLILYENTLNSLPLELLRLKNLERLDVAKNKLSKLPESFGKLENLKTLVLYGNQIKSLPKSFSSLKKLNLLILGANQFNQIPQEILTLRELEILNLSYNKLTKLPESIGELVKLKKVILHGNQLTGLPKSFSNLEKLKSLQLDSNQFTQIPSEVLQLKELEVLSLSKNKLIKLPYSFGELENLKKLSLYENQLQDLPASFSKLHKLEFVRLDSNQFHEIPHVLLKLNLDILLKEQKASKGIAIGNNPFISEQPDSLKQGQQINQAGTEKQQQDAKTKKQHSSAKFWLKNFCHITLTEDYAIEEPHTGAVLQALAGSRYLINSLDFSSSVSFSDFFTAFYLDEQGIVSFKGKIRDAKSMQFMSNCKEFETQWVFAVFTDVTLFVDRQLSQPACQLSAGTAIDVSGYHFGRLGNSWSLDIEELASICNGHKDLYFKPNKTQFDNKTIRAVPLGIILRSDN